MRDANPNAVAVMIRLIKTLVPGLAVAASIPKNPPEVMVRVTRTGGVMKNPITDVPMFSVAVYGASRKQAEEISQQLRHVLHRQDWQGIRLGGVLLRGWREAAGPAEYADPDQPRLVRFQFTGELLLSTLQN